MKNMKTLLRRVYLSDHALEVVFSSSRWFFLILSTIVFFSQYKDESVLHMNLFLCLLAFGVLYMALADLCLHKASIDSKWYKIMTKGGPFFDYVSFFFLVALTGGIESPLFPIAYLIILHAAVYWKFVGALISALFLMLGHSVVFFIQGLYTIPNVLTFITQVLFLFLMGFIGGLIVSRERKHFIDKTVLEGIANCDYLTNLLNHRSFQEHLQVDCAKQKAFQLVFADVDKFKQVNDQYGHVTGDQVLQNVANLMQRLVPDELGHVYRYGGEEFAMLIDSEDRERVQTLLETIRQQIANEVYHLPEGEFSVTMSFGCGQFCGEKPVELVDKVDKLLYEAKKHGRNRIVYSQEYSGLYSVGS